MDKPKISGPLLAAALIADRMIVEGDGVISAMRVVDQITFPAAPFKKGEKVVIPQTLLLMFKSGGFKGKRKLRLTLVTPSGKAHLAATQELDFSKCDNPEGGVNIGTPLMITWDGPGLYWFDVYLGEKVMTKMPFRLHVAESNADIKLIVGKKEVDARK